MWCKPAQRRWVLILFASILLIGCQAGIDERGDEAQCAALVEHTVSLEYPADDERGSELERHRATLKAAIRDRVIADCLAKPRAFAECALEAKSAREMEVCR